ncbi:MAG: hypothetical protein EAZ08_05850 [Cytophagales bacterium]|nr:MAG: hypothetical protein EAZ08_05850 [Cytophagales bacterium]
MNKFSTIFIFLIFIFCCNHAQSQGFVLRGRVVKPDFIPVHNITVFVEGYPSSDKTTVNGEFKVVMPKEIGNPQRIEIESDDGFEYKRHNYYPKESRPLEIVIDLPARALKGRVLYRSGRGVISGSVSIKDAVLKDSIHTDKLGYFSVMLPEGFSVSSVYNSNALIINGKSIKKENARLMSANFIQVRLLEDRPSSLYTVAVYNKNKLLIGGLKVNIDGVRYNIDNQGFVKINNPNLKKSAFEVEGYKMIGTPQFIDDDNLVEIYVERLTPPANGIIKEKVSSKTNNLQDTQPAPQDSIKSKYEGEISSLSANIESSRRDFENNNKKLATKFEQLSEKLSSDVNITPAQIDGLKNQLGDLEKTLAENDASYERSKLQTQNLLNRLKEAILQKDSIGRELLAAENSRKALEKEKKKIEIERKEEEESFKTKLWGISSVSVMLSILLLMVYIFSTRLRKQKKEVEKTKNELLEKVQEIEHKNAQLRITLDELKKAQAQLVSSEKMASLGQLTAGIAHEINNPVNFTYAGAISLRTDFNDLIQLLEQYRQISIENVMTNLPLAKKVEKDVSYPEIREEIDELLVSIKRGAERTAEIVKSLRTFARLDEDTLKKVDIEENLDATLVMLHSQYKDRIEIVKQYGKIPPVECLPGQMNQVFMNILMNAIQATEGKGKIFISTAYPSVHADEKYKNAIEISIRDTGTGMSEEVKNNIFEPFFTTKDVGSGSGLGLSVSFGILEKHKGEIKVFSELGKGSEFVIILPLISQQLSNTANQSLISKNPSNKLVS